jgi:hypothetical protein
LSTATAPHLRILSTCLPAITLVINVTPRITPPIAICLALIGQVVGVFGLPVVRGSSPAPDAPCGCCLADRTAGRCCCHHDADASDDVAPCCRGKNAGTATVTWISPTLQSKCQGPKDVVPGSVVPASIPPEPAVTWSVLPNESSPFTVFDIDATSLTVPPDDPPPRSI